MGENNGSCISALLFIVMFILVCVIRCDQVKEQRKLKEIENMIEFVQKQVSVVNEQVNYSIEQNDSILNNIKKE